MKKQNWLRMIRIIVSLFVLIGFIIVFSDVRGKTPSGLATILTYLQFWPSIQKLTALPAILASGFIAIIILTFIAGRVYCSTICPLGIIQDILGFLTGRIARKKQKLRYTRPLNLFRYALLGLIIISIFYVELFAINLLDPFANSGRIFSTIYQPVLIAGNNLVSKILMSMGIYFIQPLPIKVFYPLPFFFSTAVLLTLIVMVLYRGRLYCNSICPVGTILGLISKVSILKISIKNQHCSQCGKCQTACKANCINIKDMTVDASRCVACYNCIDQCKESSIGYFNSYLAGNIPKSEQNLSKRRFFKSGVQYMASYPLLAQLMKADSASDDGPGRFEKSEHQNHGSLFNQRGPISPPGSKGLEYLKANCIGCQVCVSTCPTKVLQPAFLEYGFTGMMLPRMNNDVGFCNYECTKCGEVCPTGAILPLTKQIKIVTQIGLVVFERHHCVVYTSEKSCGSCSEHCPTQAVHMVHYKGILTIPETNPEICIGCGACEHVCPVTDPHVAIFVVPNNIHKIAHLPAKEEKLKVDTAQDFPF